MVHSKISDAEERMNRRSRNRGLQDPLSGVTAATSGKSGGHDNKDTRAAYAFATTTTSDHRPNSAEKQRDWLDNAATKNQQIKKHNHHHHRKTEYPSLAHESWTFKDIHWRNTIVLGIAHILAVIAVVMLLSSRWKDIGVSRTRALLEMIVWWWIAGLGVTAGLHRLWSHRSYQAHWTVRFALMLCSQMSNQGSIRYWCRDHRVHHKHSDTIADPHNASRGFFYSHVGNFLLRKTHHVKEEGARIDMSDLDDDWIVRLDGALQPWNGLFMCFVLPSIYGHYAWGCASQAFWVLGPLRYVIELNATWCINSVNHFWGIRPNNPETRPANNIFTSLLALGEGEHDFHHQYAWDAATQESPFGVNLTWAVLSLLRSVGLVYNVRRAKRYARKVRGNVTVPKAQCISEPVWKHLQRVVNSTLGEYRGTQDTLVSMLYLVRDLVFAGLVTYVGYVIYSRVVEPCTAWWPSLLFLVVYAAAAGTVYTGLWVLAHECGHGAFSKSPRLNFVVGYILHTAMLVPYSAWRATHDQHHRFTNDTVRGSTHVPTTRSVFRGIKLREMIGEDAFVGISMLLRLFIGWPMFLFKNTSGPRVKADAAYSVAPDKLGDPKYRINKRGDVSHFSPWSQVLPSAIRLKVVFGTLGLLAVVATLIWAGTVWGFSAVLRWYIGPYITVNCYLVLYTYLHHTHANVPHMHPTEFSFVRGALSTIDRPYPDFLNYLHHHIGSTHVVHHLDKSIPHYRAVDATCALTRAFHKENLGDYYQYDRRSIWIALWETTRDCLFIESVDGVQFFKKQ